MCKNYLLSIPSIILRRVFSSRGVGVPQLGLRKSRTIDLLFSKQYFYYSLALVLPIAIMWIALFTDDSRFLYLNGSVKNPVDGRFFFFSWKS